MHLSSDGGTITAISLCVDREDKETTRVILHSPLKRCRLDGHVQGLEHVFGEVLAFVELRQVLYKLQAGHLVANILHMTNHSRTTTVTTLEATNWDKWARVPLTPIHFIKVLSHGTKHLVFLNVKCKQHTLRGNLIVNSVKTLF